MQHYEYKGFIIYPDPRLSFDSDYWMINLTIRHGDKEKSFTVDNSFTTMAQAAFHSIHYGKRIIDGEIEEQTIDDIL